MKRILISIAFMTGAFFSAAAEEKVPPVSVVIPAGSQPRTRFGATRLEEALVKAGYPVNEKNSTTGTRIVLHLKPGDSTLSKEAFSIISTGNGISISATGPSGLLYGCLELAGQIKATGKLPTRIDLKDGPEMVLRGTCIGVQKPTLLPGRGPYEYPYTPENFPWFYDKALWIKYLDSLVDNRLNTLYLWNGHPFASLVRVADYPYAVEVDDATFKKNEEMFRFLTTEADKRGIWVIQLFYNIIVSKPFAEKNHLKTQDRNRHIIPLIADYTRKSIAAFVQKYPNVGLMVTLGEAMEGVGQDDIDWFTGTIIPGIRDGLKALGRKDEPPLVLRAHDTDAPSVMKAALPLYKNLYVEAKYNGEALTTYTPHGSWADLHRTLSRVAVALIENVHIMANLEPFRYGSADFIQKCVQAMHSVYGANGLHLYPQASYWDWPYTADRTEPRTLEMERDWIWYKEWARYAWNCHRNRQEEIVYWSRQLAARYGCDEAQGREILEAYEQSGEIAPELLRRFGITDGNRQTLTLGMLMTELIDPERYGLFSLLYESEGPPGEMLSQYAEKEWKHLPHEGETPVDAIRSVRERGAAAVAAIDKAAAFITTDTAEFARLRNDMYCYKALADCYADKAEAALAVLRYKYSHDPADLEHALPLLQRSVAAFKALSQLAGPAYLYANSMQTPQRKIPVRGTDGKFITWAELLPIYQQELDNFEHHLSAEKVDSDKAPPPPNLTPVSVALQNSGAGSYRMDSGARPFTDSSLIIRVASPVLKGLTGICQSAALQRKEGTHITFTCTEPVDLLVGFFDEKRSAYLQPSLLETDASANDYGQADARMLNALEVEGLPAVNIHTWSFKTGTHTLDLGKGLCLVLGFAKPLGPLKGYDAGANEPGKVNIDGLFDSAQPNDLLLWYRQPAEKWTEALPIGNGRLGAMIFGGVTEDHLQFNESTLWSGGPRHYEHPGAAAYLPAIRQLLANGQQAKAEALAEAHFMGLKDRDEAEYAALKKEWFEKVRKDTGFAAAGLDDAGWKTMQIPTPDGWEAAGLQGVDGAIWFRTSFDLPASWTGEDLALDLGRIRDLDYTYVNGKLAGTGEGISSKRHYIIKASLLRPGRNVIAIQVINFDDKGGLTGVKSGKVFVLSPVGSTAAPLALPETWKYKIQDEDPPLLPKYQADYLPFGDLYLRFPGQESSTDYRRQLDLNNAISTVSYNCNGAHYSREYFASVPQQTILCHIVADKPGAVNMEASLTTPHRSFSIRRIDDHTLGLFLQVRNGVLKGTSYLRVTASRGKVTVSGDKIIVKDADDVTCYLAAATSFVTYQDVSADPEARCRTVMTGLKDHDYASIKAAHIREYQGYFNTFSVQFGAATNAALPTDERILQYSPEKDPALLALYMQYGRYLLIASSRPGSPMPANLQGIWNDLLSPPWGSKFTTNINLEMNYWPAEELNLSACSEPYFRLVRDLSVTGSLTAKAHYNAQGWVLHHNTDLWRGTAPINASNHGIWVTGGAWLCHQIWEHYVFTQDRDFLREYYPVMRESAMFFLDFLVKDPHADWLISDPSNSPEHGGLVAGPTMDHEIIRDLFKNCIAAAAILKKDAAFSKILSVRFTQIAPDRIGKYGQLQEWLEDKDDTADTHRHISHLWGVYPGTDITWKDSTLMKAARQSLIYRGDDGTGWSLAWKVNCWARFKEGDHALRLVNKLLSSAAGTQAGERGGIYPNMFDAHPPFQIDGNFGGAAGIAEMLLQSQNGYLELLPALPAALPAGAIKGLCARGGFVLDLKWQQGALQQVEIVSRRGGECELHYGSKRVRLSTHAGEHIRLSGDLKIIE